MHQEVAKMKKIQEEAIPLVFFRAPFVIEVSTDVEVLIKLEEHIVACQQNHMLATFFHPELTSDLSMQHYFVNQLC